MYHLMRQRKATEVLSQETPPLLVSLVVAEVLFKFHSFTLECLAFLATWYGLSWAWARVRRSAPASSHGRRS